MSAILLVDDTRENLVAVHAILEPLGHELVTASSGEAALRALLLQDFAVILLDVQMPGMDGFETAELIKQRERTRDIPIIFLTAISKDDQHVFRGYSAGAVDYIFKPYDPEILRAKVAVFVDLHEKTVRLQRHEEELRERKLAELRATEERRYRELAEAMPQMVWTARPDGEIDYVNSRWVEYTGQAPAAGGGGMTGIVHPDEAAETAARWTAAVESGAPFEMEYRLQRASDGVYRWHLGRALPTHDPSGAIVAWVGTCTDIDDQKRLEQAERFLVQAGAALHGSLEYDETLAAVADLAVPHIADWCRVDVVEDGRLRTVALAHVDAAKIQFVRELQERYPTPVDAPTGPAAVVRTQESALVAEIAEEMLVEAAVDDLHLELIRELGLRSYMCVPLVAHGRALGAITLVAAESERRYEASDLALAEELARRAATAVENAQLYAEAEARAQAARVLASVGDGVFLVERGTNVVRLWNPAAEAITGVREADVLGRGADEAIPGWADIRDRVPTTASPGDAAGPRAQTLPLEVDGRELWLSIAGVELDDGVVYAFRDLTQERMLERMKSDFVATVSHELRTPLAAIYGSALTMGRDDLELDDEMRDRLLKVIADESDRLARIVNDLLLASHLDSGRLQVSIESCDAEEIVKAVVDAAATHLPENVAVELEQPAKVPQVAADPGQLRQVLVNLVENAVKYSPEGGVVRVAIEPANGNVRFSVADDGIGIPVGEHERIFEKFYRLDPNMTRGIGGTGLGLYISRELVRRVGGRIWVESRQGGGSAFFVEVPVAEEARRRARRGREEPGAIASGSRAGSSG